MTVHKLIIVCATALSGLLCILATVLILAGQQVSTLLTVVGVGAGPLMVAFIIRIYANTNGNVTKQQNLIVEMTRLLSVSPSLSPKVLNMIKDEKESVE